MKTKTKKKKLNKKKLFIFILFFYLIGCCGYYIYNEPIRNIIITGNTLVKDSEIIEVAGIKNYPSIFNVKTRKVKKILKNIDLIEEVTIKKNYRFQLKIEVKEAKLLFFNTNNNKIMLSSGKEISNNGYIGIPTLINYTPEKILKEFSLKLGDLDTGIISLISEIEYAPTKSEDGKTIDENSFILFMNDGNTVKTNTSKCDNLTHYREIYASLKDKKGTLNLDSGNYENFVFIPY